MKQEEKIKLIQSLMDFIVSKEFSPEIETKVQRETWTLVHQLLQRLIKDF